MGGWRRTGYLCLVVTELAHDSLARLVAEAATSEDTDGKVQVGVLSDFLGDPVGHLACLVEEGRCWVVKPNGRQAGRQASKQATSFTYIYKDNGLCLM